MWYRSQLSLLSAMASIALHLSRTHSITMLAVRIILFISAVHAFPWEGARPTDNLNLPLYNAVPPLPTDAPLLRERQAAGDVTCAWEDGKGTNTYQLYCASQKVCATNSYSGFGCCDTQTLDDCPLATACLDSTAIASYSSKYGSDDFAISCTASQNPNCVTQLVLLNPLVTGYLCGPANGARTETYYSTYFNQSATSKRPSPTYYNAVYLSYTTPILKSSTQSTSKFSTTSAPATTPTTVSVASATSSSSSTPTPTPDSGSSTPVGAIVGGVVGGVAVIAIVGLLAFFLVRRSKRNNAQTGGQPPVQQQPQGPQPVQYPQSPAQTEYGYAGQPPQQQFSQQQPYQTNQGYYPEKTPGQSTSPIQGTPQMGYSSPSSPQPERLSNIPPSYPRHELDG